MLPVYLRTNDPLLAWQAGLAWAFIEGAVEVIGAFVAPYVRRATPRAALLGTLAGISIAFISMRPATQIMMTPWIGLVSFAIVIGGWIAGVQFPFRLPAGLLAILVGTALGWATGVMQPGLLYDGVGQLRLASRSTTAGHRPAARGLPGCRAATGDRHPLRHL